MSLIRPILRVCIVQALKEATWAEERVYDSDKTPLLDALMNGPAKPYIVVFTDNDNRTSVEGMDIHTAHREVSVVLEIGVASAIAVEGENAAQLVFPQTDEAMEFAVDVIEGQAIHTLVSDPKSQWGELFRKIVMRIFRVPSMRGGSADTGTRWAARQVTIVCETISDLPPGVVAAPDHVVHDFLAAAAASPDAQVRGAGTVVSKLLNTVAAPEWRQAQAWLGLTESGVRSMGIAPLPEEPEDEDPHPLVTGDVEYDDTIGPLPYPGETRIED